MVKSPWDTWHNYYRNMAIAVVHHENDVFNAKTPPLPPPIQCCNVSSTLATRIQHCLGGGGEGVLGEKYG